MTTRLVAALASAALVVPLAAAVPATAQARIKPRAGQWVRGNDPSGVAILFLDVTRDRRTVKNISVSFWCGGTLTSVPVGKAKIRKVGRRTVGFHIVHRRVSMPNGHKMRVTMSGEWSGPKKVGGAVRLRDPDCGPPPDGVDNPRTWTAGWDPGNQPGS
jgi:hypothetical protein